MSGLLFFGGGSAGSVWVSGASGMFFRFRWAASVMHLTRDSSLSAATFKDVAHASRLTASHGQELGGPSGPLRKYATYKIKSDSCKSLNRMGAAALTPARLDTTMFKRIKRRLSAGTP